MSGLDPCPTEPGSLTGEPEPVPEQLVDVRFFYNNVSNNRERVHTLLASSKYDVLALLDTPWYPIGANRLLSSNDGHTVFGTMNNAEYQYYHPTGKLDEKAYVAVYIKKKLIPKFEIVQRLDVINSPFAMGIYIDDSLLICAYNKPPDKNNTMMHKIMAIVPDDELMIIFGDFNTHAPLWDAAYVPLLPP